MQKAIEPSASSHTVPCFGVAPELRLEGAAVVSGMRDARGCVGMCAVVPLLRHSHHFGEGSTGSGRGETVDGRVDGRLFKLAP